MRIIKAFFLALCLFVCTVIGIRLYVTSQITSDKNDIGYYLDRTKYLSTSAIEKNLKKGTALVVGSSEFRRVYDSEFHPKQAVNAKDESFMLVGEGSFQSLSHAIRLGALSNSVPDQKVTIILSPQWFSDTGINPTAFTSRFSEDNFIGLLKAPNVSKETKKAIVKRTNKLLAGAPQLLERVKGYEDSYLRGDASMLDNAYTGVFQSLMSLKADVAFMYNYKTQNVYGRNAHPKPKFNGIDKKKLEEEAERIGKQSVTNPYNMDDYYFNAYFKKELAKFKNSQSNRSYAKSPEYDDLKLFLDVCKDAEIKVNIISVPVNGYWYDYMGFSKEDRQTYYQNIRNISKQYNTALTDLSSYEYEKYFFEDGIHFTWKGWIHVNESIVEFEK